MWTCQSYFDVAFITKVWYNISMGLVLNEEQKRVLIEIIGQLQDSETVHKAKTRGLPEKIKLKGVSGAISVKASGLCPEMCFRFQEYGTCVHLDKSEKETVPGYTVQFARLREEKKLRRVQLHKDRERPSEWQCVERDDWQRMPLTYGMYIWVDVNDRPVYFTKAVDLRRRHYTWAKLVQTDARWVKTVKIWWIHTGWYSELIECLMNLGKNIVITRRLLDQLLKEIKPFELPEPPPLG